MPEGRLLVWDDLHEGMSVTVPFAISDRDMETFIALTGDTSLIHTDDAEAKAQGFKGVIVYGGLLTAKLSHMLGMHLPGMMGLSNTWQINFHRPLYTGEDVELCGKVVHLSEATKVVSIKFTMRRGKTLIADGSIQTMLLPRKSIA